jgi:Secretion system C-terminal sorting domain
VPNGGFETWTSPNAPDYWGTFGNVTGAGTGGFVFPYFAVKDISAGNHVEGLASLELITDTFPAFAGGFVLSSVACLGGLSLDATNQFHFSGVPYTKRPDTLYFSYKYVPAIPADTGIMEFYVQKKDTSLMGGFGYAIVYSLSNTNGNWANIAIPLAGYYTSAAQPDTLQMLFFSSTDTAAATFGTKLWIDAIHFDASVNIANGIDELTNVTNGVKAYPNPATSQVNIAIAADEIGSQIQLFDMEGRMVYSGVLDNTTLTIDTRALQSGVYSIHVNSVDKLTTYKGRITIVK